MKNKKDQSSFSSPPQSLVTKAVQNFLHQLFWTALRICCSANSFVFKHRSFCGLRKIRAFLFLSSSISVLQFLCVRSWERRLGLACLWLGWAATLSFCARELSKSRAWALQCVGHQLLRFPTWSCSVLPCCLFLANPPF